VTTFPCAMASNREPVFQQRKVRVVQTEAIEATPHFGQTELSRRVRVTGCHCSAIFYRAHSSGLTVRQANPRYVAHCPTARGSRADTLGEARYHGQIGARMTSAMSTHRFWRIVSEAFRPPDPLDAPREAVRPGVLDVYRHDFAKLIGLRALPRARTADTARPPNELPFVAARPLEQHRHHSPHTTTVEADLLASSSSACSSVSRADFVASSTCSFMVAAGVPGRELYLNE
jgi:hypothetical protein